MLGKGEKRLVAAYSAAHFAPKHENVELVQLVSFGCGIDSITSDEVRRILENGDKFYTQIKIDEINNLGAVKIRVRSLLSAVDLKNKEAQLKNTKTIQHKSERETNFDSHESIVNLATTEAI